MLQPHPKYNFWVYMTTNPKKTVLYTGVTNNLERRLSEHCSDNMDDKNSFAGKYFCYNLVYFEYHRYILNAIAREKEIKSWTRAKKDALIHSFNPDWRFLNNDIQYMSIQEMLKSIEVGNILPSRKEDKKE
jgi:putative endonuclease